MQKLYLVLLTLCLSACFQADPESTRGNQPESAIDVKDKTKTLDLKSLSSGQETISNADIVKAFKNKQSDTWVTGTGEVVKLLRDDTKGSRHQRFLVKISYEQTLLFAHNIDLAPRINALQVGDIITFRGEYEYNPKGGIVHWTHHDPQGRRNEGWIKHQGKTYE